MTDADTIRRPAYGPRCSSWRTAPSTAATATAQTGASPGRGGFLDRYDRLPGNPDRPLLRGSGVVQTAPHIGNTGVNTTDAEVPQDLGCRLRGSRRSTRGIQLAVLSAPSTKSSSGRASSVFRALTLAPLTRRLRSSGSMRAGVFSGEHAERPKLNCWRRCALRADGWP